MKNTFIYLIIAVSSTILTSASLPIPNEDIAKWEKLGTSSVDFKLDRDVIHIGAKEGRFSRLKLEVTGGTLSMHKMKIEYYSGQIEIVNIKHKFTRRSSSSTIDIDGRKRKIKDITFWYNTSKRSKRKAKVTVFGK